eukprot:Lankesteria_metandrocarpae@DN10301_c0_g1_i1.p1
MQELAAAVCSSSVVTFYLTDKGATARIYGPFGKAHLDNVWKFFERTNGIDAIVSAEAIKDEILEMAIKSSSGDGATVSPMSTVPMVNDTQHSNHSGNESAHITVEEFLKVFIGCCINYAPAIEATEKPITYSSSLLLIAVELIMLRRYKLFIGVGGASGVGKTTMGLKVEKELESMGCLNTTLVCSDKIRKKLREGISKDANPVLHASTYNAADHIECTADNTAAMLTRVMAQFDDGGDGHQHSLLNCRDHMQRFREVVKTAEQVLSRCHSEAEVQLTQMVGQRLQGYILQSHAIHYELFKQILVSSQGSPVCVVEGVHLTPYFLQAASDALRDFHKDVCCDSTVSFVPLLLYVSDHTSHLQRFASRSPTGSLDPQENEYVKDFETIRAIQSYLLDNSRWSAAGFDKNDFLLCENASEQHAVSDTLRQVFVRLATGQFHIFTKKKKKKKKKKYSALI